MQDNGKEDAHQMQDNGKEDARKGAGADKQGGGAFKIPLLLIWKNRGGGADKQWGGTLTVLYGTYMRWLVLEHTKRH